MVTKVQKWGNSLGLRIPKSFAAEVRVAAGSIVDISVRDGSLVVRRYRGSTFTLDGLLKGVTSKNLHDEVGTGRPAGKERP
jgi:antitoxin MazE